MFEQIALHAVEPGLLEHGLKVVEFDFLRVDAQIAERVMGQKCLTRHAITSVQPAHFVAGKRQKFCGEALEIVVGTHQQRYLVFHVIADLLVGSNLGGQFKNLQLLLEAFVGNLVFDPRKRLLGGIKIARHQFQVSPGDGPQFRVADLFFQVDFLYKILHLNEVIVNARLRNFVVSAVLFALGVELQAKELFFQTTQLAHQ